MKEMCQNQVEGLERPLCRQDIKAKQKIEKGWG
jgi:hypothetical protein